MNPIALWTNLLPLAEAAKKQPSGDSSGSPYSFLIMMAFMFLIIYFLMIHPQRKRQRERLGMLEALKKGDKVITAGGIHGIVTLVRDHDIKLKIAEDCEVLLSKSGISRRVPSEEAEGKDKTENK